MRAHCQRVLFIFFLGAALRALAVVGDVNGDGRVDVADAMRVDEMLAGNLAVDPLADVDGDGAVTETDRWLVREAALGTPLPMFLAAATIGPAGGEVAGGGGRLVVPPGAVADSATVVILLRDTSGQGLDAGEVEGDVLLLTGLPRAAAGLQVRLPLPDTGAPDEWTLMGGEYLYARSSQAYAWHWRPLGRNVVTVEGSELVYALPPLPEIPDEGAPDAAAPGPPRFAMLKFAVCANPAFDRARYFNRIHTSAHFKVYAPDTVDEALIQNIQDLPNKLEATYNLVKGLGFPLDSQAGWFPVEVYLKANLSENGLFVDSYAYGKYISIRAALARDEHLSLLTATLAHEFLHLVQSYYGASIDTSGWADDATATWLEKYATGNPSYVPDVFSAPAPISGMHRTVEREFEWTINPRNVYNWQASWSRAQDHGYSMSAFFEYLVKRYDWDPHFVYKFYQRIQAGSHPVKALDEVLTSTTSYDLDTIFDFFCADYLQGKHPYLAADPRPAVLKIFATDGQRGVRHIIDKRTADPFEVFEDTLTVQELGAGMVQFKVVEPRKIFAKGTILYAEVDAEHCDRLHGIAEHSAGKEFVTGIYDSANKKFTIELPVHAESSSLMFHLLVYKNQEAVGDGYTDTFQIKVKSGFQGRLSIPPFIAFHRINNQAKYEVLAGAIFDIAPGRLEKFTGADSDFPLSYSDYDYTYHMFSNYATAMRTDDQPLTMTLYGDLRVSTIAPFTIMVKTPSSISPDGFSTFEWKHHDVPAPSGSGSPTILIEAYHSPAGGSSLNTIFHTEVGQEQLLEVNGGVELAVPPPIPGYVYTLAVAAKYDNMLGGGPTYQYLYGITIYPPAEATQ